MLGCVSLVYKKSLKALHLSLSVLAEDAIKAALADYKLKQDPNKEEPEKKAAST